MIEVYGEYLFIENFIMNFIILHITSYFSKSNKSIIKLALGALVGALYTFIIFFPSLHFMFTVFMKFVISLLIIIISFTPYKFKEFFKCLMIFYLVSFIFGGTSFAIFYLINFNSIISNGVFYSEHFTFKILIYSVALGYILILASVKLIKFKLSRERLYQDITIEFDSKEKIITALVDTGNSLSDPISNFPVIIVEYGAIEELLPDCIKGLYINNNFNELESLTNVLANSKWINRFRFIPYNSLGKTNGMLIGFKPDNVKLSIDGNVINLKKIIIGISTNKLSTNGDYKALLNPDILI